MRASKGLLAALGAGTSLAAAAVIALFSVSVLLAVHGWPQVSRADGSDSVALRAQIAATAAADGDSGAANAPAPVALPARPPAVRHRTAARRTLARRGPASRRPGATRPGTAAPAPGSSGSSGVPSPGSSGGSSPSGGSGPAPSNVVAPVTHTVGSTVTNVTDTAGGALEPVSPAVADTVTTTGQQAGDAIDQVGQAVGGVVGGLTGGGH